MLKIKTVILQYFGQGQEAFRLGGRTRYNLRILLIQILKDFFFKLKSRFNA